MTSAALQQLIERELARLGLPADELFAYSNAAVEWGLMLHVARRDFEAGCARADGFFCREKTPRGEVALVVSDTGPIRGECEPLLRSALMLIKAALENPGASGVRPQVI